MSRAEALEELDRAGFEPAVRTVLDRHPEGLSAFELHRRIRRLPPFELEPPFHYVHWWLGELCHDDMIAYEFWNRRHRLLEHADLEDHRDQRRRRLNPWSYYGDDEKWLNRPGYRGLLSQLERGSTHRRPS